MVRYAILGPVELCDSGRRVAVSGRRQVALLASLLIDANRAVSSDRLIDALWGDQASGAALKRLQMAIVRLRRRLDREGVPGESVLRTVAGGYLLAMESGELDAEMFQTGVEHGRRALQAGDAQRARDVLAGALAVWRGPALAQVAYEEFAQPEIRRLEELRLSALQDRVDCELRLGQHDRVIGELETLVGAHPGRERLTGLLMLALYRCGRQGDALDVYARTRAYLAGELGLEPGPALQTLQSEILAQSATLQYFGVAPERVAPAHAEVDRSGADDRPARLPFPRALHVPASSPFFGRDPELACLREFWIGRGGETRSAVMLCGEAGIGKTRLTGEFARRVHEERGLVLYGRCDEGLAVPYQPFVEALRPYARAVGIDRLRAGLGDLAPELGRLLPELAGLGQSVRSDPESERFALFEAVAALLEAMTRQQPALLIVDDLHWATQPTLLLLRHLIRSQRPHRVLLLGTYRDTELDLGQPLAQLLADLHRDAGTEHLSIRGLNEHAIAALLQAAAGRPLDERASQLVHALAVQTAGNPLYLRELLADLLETGAFSPAGHSLDPAATVTHLNTPERLRHVIGHRVARLSAPAVRALRVAAVAGPASSFVLLERVLGEPATLLDVLDEAVAARLLVETGNGYYAFTHALVRQTIYEQLSDARRLHLHRQLGEALETLEEDPETHIEALAHHFAKAAPDGQAHKAADYALAAGRKATTTLGYEDAAEHYQRGLEALDRSGHSEEQRRYELLLALGEVRWGLGELDNARRACRQAAELAEKLGDATRLAQAALGFCGPHRFEGTATVRRSVADVLQRALAALGEDDSALRSQLLGRLAIYTDIEHRKRVLAHQALEMGRRVADDAALSDVLVSTHWVTRGPDTLHESMALAKELARVADAVGDGRRRALAHGRLIDVLLELGDIDAVHREFEALRRLAETRKERYVKRLLAAFQASHAYLQGQLEDCERLAHDALAHRFTGHDQPAHTFGLQMFFVRLEQGRLDEFVDTVEGFAAHPPQLDRWRCALAYSYAQLERTAQARQELEALARDDFSDLPRDVLWLSNLSALAEIVVLLDDAPRAQSLHRLLLPYANRCVVAFAGMCHGSASRSLGLLATTLSHYDDAEQHFQHALKMNTQIRSPLWTAHTQHDYARMLLARGRSGDHHKALDLLEQALTTAEQLGLKALVDKTRPLKLAVQSAELRQPRRAGSRRSLTRNRSEHV
jgi:DNA-binding SARP family transcriptional activator